MHPGFDPSFDDCRWTDEWARIPIAQVVPGVYESFVVKSWQMSAADVCGQRIALSPPLEVRGLITADGTLWMSDVPQERLMMFNNALASRGRVLVGGLGLGLYPQYALPYIESLTIIEHNAALSHVVAPLVRLAAESRGIPLAIRQGDIREVLSAPPTARHDTIFLDTWDTLDAAHLPAINRLRNLAADHLAPGGRILLWGYRWMLRLFEEACRALFELPATARQPALARQRPDVQQLLQPVIQHFADQAIVDLPSKLEWCVQYAIEATLPEESD